MRFIIGVAGVPDKVFPFFNSDRARLFDRNDNLIAIPLKPADALGPPAYRYFPKYASAYIDKFHDEILKEDDGREPRYFVMLYIRHQVSKPEADFQRLFHPALFTHEIDLPFDATNRLSAVKEYKNDLVDRLRTVLHRTKQMLPLIYKEVVENANRTPLLLPPKNFRSDHLEPSLRAVAGYTGRDFEQCIALAKRAINDRHAKRGDKMTFFTDDRSVAFRPPGHEKHGKKWPDPNHPKLCLITGHRRLGSPHNSRFHYDCIRESGRRLEARFFHCHGEDRDWRGDPHLNISPNDFIRA